MNDTTNGSTPLRDSIAIKVLKYGMLSIGVIAITIIIGAYNHKESDPVDVSLRVFNTLLPVLASWVGTVIAFYFGKENFESATKQINSLVNKITPDMYKDVPVKQVMIDAATMTKYKGADKATLTLGDVDSVFQADLTKGRLPIVDANCKPLFIIHLDELNRLKKDEKNYNPASTLDRFKAYGFEEPKGFVVLPDTATLNDAQQAIKKIPGCLDVFITKTGSPNEELLGWLTDSRILNFLQ